jgi:hypothetical protein
MPISCRNGLQAASAIALMNGWTWRRIAASGPRSGPAHFFPGRAEARLPPDQRVKIHGGNAKRVFLRLAAAM